MSNRSTGIGATWRRDPEKARAEIAEAIESTRGNLRRAAYVLGLEVRTLYRYVHRANLWAEVDKARDVFE